MVLHSIFHGIARHAGTAEGGTVATLGTIVLHGIGRLALHDRDFTAAVVARVLGPDFHPTARSLAVWPRGLEFGDRNRLARTAHQHHRVAGLYRLSLRNGRDGFEPIPVLGAGAGKGRGGSRDDDGEQADHTQRAIFRVHIFRGFDVYFSTHSGWAVKGLAQEVDEIIQIFS